MSPAALLAALLLLAPLRLVLDAPDEAPPDSSLTWHAWTPGQAIEAEPVASDEQVGSSAPRTLNVALPADGGRWTLVVEGESGGDAWFAVADAVAVTGADADSDDGGVERAPLTAVPVPTPSMESGVVKLQWDAARAPGVSGWQVLRLAQGKEPELVGEVSVSATSFRDEPPAGEHSWCLRPVFAEGVTGPIGRSSEPLVLSR